MKQKRGQITLFIIIGIVVLFGVFAVLYVNAQIKKQNQPVVTEVERIPIKVEPIKQFVQGCIDQAAKDSLSVIGLTGGNVEATKYYFEDPYSFAFSATAGRNILPSLKNIESQLSDLMSAGVDYCVNNMIGFSAQGYDVLAGDFKTNVTFGAREVAIRVNYPLEITQSGSKTEISEFVSRIPIRFSYIHSVAHNISELSVKSGGAVDLSYINSVKDLNITVASNLEGQNVYLLKDDQSLLENEPYIFMMATER